MQLLTQLRNRIRFTLAVARDQTLRLRISDAQGFYAALDEAGIPYVVLRWADEIPIRSEDEATHRNDIDHLIAEGSLPKVLRLSMPFAGRLKCDFYTLRGDRGGGYLGMPYYMPEIARGILERRVQHPKGFNVPSPRDATLSFAYHLVYHKGARAGLATGLPDVTPSANPSRNYLAELMRLAAAAALPLPEPLTLQALHEWLRQEGWAMPLDLMLRWPDKHAALKALTTLEKARLANLAERVRRMAVFVLRADADTADARRMALTELGGRFAILEQIELSADQQTRLMQQTRGGNWTEKTKDLPTPPTLAVVCRFADQPGPLPVAMSAEKIKRRYPHLENTDLLVKRRIRDLALKMPGVAQDATVIHATDNAFETAETMTALYGQNLNQALARFADIA